MAEIVLSLFIGMYILPITAAKLESVYTKHKLKKKIKKFFMKRTYISDSKDICVICQDDYSEVEKCAELNCNHKYHKKCIIKWMKEKPTCPLCNLGLMKHDGERLKMD